MNRQENPEALRRPIMHGEADALRAQGLDVETVGDILEGGRQQPEPVTLLDPPRLDDTPPFPEPGIYFNMPEADYHAVPALSNSGIKALASSPMLFWARSWLNPDKEEEDKEHRILGNAYHCRILEGRQTFEKRFAVSLDRKDYPDALSTNDEIKAAIYEAGERPVSVVPTGGTKVSASGKESPITRAAKKEDWIEQLLKIDPAAQIWDEIVLDHAGDHAGKAMIGQDQWKRLEIAAYMIDRDPELTKAFSGGHPEVSLFWHCSRTGVPMKARVDYLKIRAMVDLKSFGNQRERSIERAIAYEIAGYHYNIQPSVYFEGAEEVRKIVRERGAAAVHGLVDPTWALQWAKHTEPDRWLFVFQQKGPAPVTRGLWYPRGGSTKTITDEIVRRQKLKFREYARTFGVEPWLDIEPIYDLADEDIPPFATEI